MNIKKSVLSTPLLLILLFLFVLLGRIFPQSNENAEAKIVLNNYTANKDTSIQLGLLIQLAKDWHIYWKNYGDIGIPTLIEWNIPREFQSTQIQWPIPQIFEYDGLVSFGYEDQVLFIISIDIPKDKLSDSIKVSVKLESLICKYACIPFDINIKYTIDLRKDHSATKTITGLFAHTKNNLPAEIVNYDGFSARISSDQVNLRIAKSSEYYADGSDMFFIPYENGLFKNALNQKLLQGENYREMVIESDPFRTKVPKRLYGLVIFNLSDGVTVSRKAYEINLPISK
jgi:DsbC/DsbD-like thiol-disulfide interchange protein